MAGLPTLPVVLSPCLVDLTSVRYFPINFLPKQLHSLTRKTNKYVYTYIFVHFLEIDNSGRFSTKYLELGFTIEGMFETSDIFYIEKNRLQGRPDSHLFFFMIGSGLSWGSNQQLCDLNFANIFMEIYDFCYPCVFRERGQ